METAATAAASVGNSGNQLYEALGLDGHGCPTDDDIRKAYHKLCRQFHPDKLGRLENPSELEEATVKFQRIKDAYEALMGEDQSKTEAAPSARQKHQPGHVGETAETVGTVFGVRRYGKNLAFVDVQLEDTQVQKDYLSEGHDEPVRQTLVFDSKLFDHSSPNQDTNSTPDPGRWSNWKSFPSGKRDVCVGDYVHAVGRWTLMPLHETAGLRVERWVFQRPEESALHSSRSAAKEVQRLHKNHGKAAAAGWVSCPLCPNSGRRFNRDKGLSSHLDRFHAQEREEYVSKNLDLTPAERAEKVKEWQQELLQRADAEGITMRRSAAENDGPDAAHRNRGTGYVQSSLELCIEEPGSSGSNLRHPALIAARDGNLQALHAYLAGGWKPLDAGSLDRHGASALDWAAGGGHLDCVRLLAPLTVGGVACRRDGRGPAHWAARHGRTDVLKFLLSISIDPNTRTTNGTTMLMFAAFGGHTDAGAVLLESRANLDSRNAWDCDVGHFAAMGGSVSACKWLVSLGVSLDRRQRSGHTALHKAADAGQLEACEYLLGHLSAAQLRAVAECTEQELQVAAADLAASGDSGEADQSTATVVQAPLALRARAHLPSTLAEKSGHGGIAAMLRIRGL